MSTGYYSAPSVPRLICVCVVVVVRILYYFVRVIIRGAQVGGSLFNFRDMMRFCQSWCTWRNKIACACAFLSISYPSKDN